MYNPMTTKRRAASIGNQAKGLLLIVMMVAICVYVGAKFQDKIDINETENPEAFAANASIWSMLWETFDMFDVILLLIVVGIIWYLVSTRFG